MNIVEALKSVAKDCPNAYAVGYAREALTNPQVINDPEAMKMQLMYVKINMAHWRGPQAKLVRAAINEAIS